MSKVRRLDFRGVPPSLAREQIQNTLDAEPTASRKVYATLAHKTWELLVTGASEAEMRDWCSLLHATKAYVRDHDSVAAERITALTDLLRESISSWVTFGMGAHVGKNITPQAPASQAPTDAVREAASCLAEKLDQTVACDLPAGKCGVPNFGQELSDLRDALAEAALASPRASVGEGAEVTAKALAERFWRIHPREIQDMGITREEFYEREILSALRASGQDVAREARMAKAIGLVLGIDVDELCAHEQSEDADGCDSPTCPGALTEDHDAPEHRERIFRMARAAWEASL